MQSTCVDTPQMIKSKGEFKLRTNPKMQPWSWAARRLIEQSLNWRRRKLGLALRDGRNRGCFLELAFG